MPSHLLQFSIDKKPVVVWNMTQACNLRCRHCYAHAVAQASDSELTTAQARDMIDDLSGFGVPVLLFSGGEPLLRSDLEELASYAVEKGMRAVISTNGTLITEEKAQALKKVGLSYVGVSLDGLEHVHDRFRGKRGAFKEAMEGANPVLLEPIMNVTIVMPEEAMGNVIGDLNSRRGKGQGMDTQGANQKVAAQAPMAEMLSYASTLNSLTSGRGMYSMEFSHYEEVPAHLAQSIIDDVKKMKEEKAE